MKKNRHSEILSIISQYTVSTQEELLERLKERGCSTTQATVSRDIKELNLIKQMNKQGVYHYVENHSNTEEYLSKYNAIFSHSVISTDVGGYTTVIKCYNGMAQAACAAFDNMQWEGLVGTIAGDDTIFALCRTPELAKELSESIKKLIK